MKRKPPQPLPIFDETGRGQHPHDTPLLRLVTYQGNAQLVLVDTYGNILENGHALEITSHGIERCPGFMSYGTIALMQEPPSKDNYHNQPYGIIAVRDTNHAAPYTHLVPASSPSSVSRRKRTP